MDTSSLPRRDGRGDVSVAGAAAALRARGLALCKIKPGEKTPSDPGWPTRSAEPDDFGGGDQVGILGGPLSSCNRPGHALVIIDLDAAAAVNLADAHLPPTAMEEGRPGKPRSHRYFLVPLDSVPTWASSHAAQAAAAAERACGHPGPFKKQLRDGADKGLIDFLGTGGQAVCPPSAHHSGERREWTGGEPGEPAVVAFGELWLAVCRLAAAAGGVPPSGLRWPWDEPRSVFEPRTAAGPDALGRATAYLARCPPAVASEGGHNRTLAVARAVVYGFDLGADAGFELLRREYNHRCVPPWSDGELWHKCKDADRLPYGKPRGWLLDAPPPEPACNGRSAHAERPSVGDAYEPPEDRLRRPPGAPDPAPDPEPLPIISAGQLLDTYRELRPPVIEGLLRAGETMNVIAPSKVGKSWLTLDLALAVATGRAWLDTFATTAGPVLVIDNELHAETIAHRVRRMAEARAVSLDILDERVFVLSLRGRMKDLPRLATALRSVERGRFAFVVLDAFYRVVPRGTDENSNADLTDLYNRLDAIAEAMGVAFGIVHHASKGDQSAKAVTDVGAGAGAQARATDTHLVLRPHEDDGVYVLDGVVRSWPPVASRCLRWQFPLWQPAPDLDPTALRTARPRRQATAAEPGSAEVPWTAERFAAAVARADPQPRAVVLAEAQLLGLSGRKAQELLTVALHRGLLFAWPAPGQSHGHLIAREAPPAPAKRRRRS